MMMRSVIALTAELAVYSDLMWIKVSVSLCYKLQVLPHISLKLHPKFDIQTARAQHYQHSWQFG